MTRNNRREGERRDGEENIVKVLDVRKGLYEIHHHVE